MRLAGCKWLDMSRKYGSYKTVWERDKKRSSEDLWKNIMIPLASCGYNSGSINIDDISVDSSTVPSKKGSKK